MALLCYCVCVEACLCSLNTVLCSLEVERFFPRIVPRPFSPLAPCLSPSPVCRLLYLLRSLVSAPGVVGSVRMHPLYACSKMHPSESSCSTTPSFYPERSASHTPTRAVTRDEGTLHSAHCIDAARTRTPSSTTCNVARLFTVMKFLKSNTTSVNSVRSLLPLRKYRENTVKQWCAPLLLWLK